MRFRNARLRTKITALLLSLTALWVFAAWVTLREGVNLLWVSTLNSGIASPIDAVQPELQRERQLTMSHLGSPGPQESAALDRQRARTDQAVATFRKSVQGREVKLAESADLKRAIANVLVQFDGLSASRNEIDSGLADRAKTAAVYSNAVDAVFTVDDSLATLDDKDFARDVRTLVQLNRAREVLSQEDALVSGVLATQRFTNSDYLQFVQDVGAQRDALAKVREELQTTDRTSYALVTQSSSITHFRNVETALMTRSKAGRRPPLGPAQWRAAADPALDTMSQAVFGGGDRLIDKSKPIAIGVIIRLVLAGGLGLVAVIASIIVSVTTTRMLLRQLEKLRGSALDLAEKRLPGVVDRLGRGEKVDVAAEAPPLEFGNDEVGQVGRAFNSVQETAIRTAVEQAELRRGIRDILLSLARRSQALVHRQLTLLDTMERRQDDPRELEDLFNVDHLATRMRRNAENLIVLSGATPARGWRRPVPMIDVVRSSVAEVEDYTRVTVMPMTGVALVGRAVGDIVHLLAELIENAVSFSPPYTQAQVSGHLVAHGYAVEIEDRGLGMTDEILADINDRVTNPPEFNLSSSAHLGLYVVGRLAMRYSIKVSLKHSSYGGTTAVVLIPRELVVESGEGDAGQAGTARGVPVGVAAGGMTATSYGDIPARVTEATVLEDPGPEGHGFITPALETLRTSSAPEAGATESRAWSGGEATAGSHTGETAPGGPSALASAAGVPALAADASGALPPLPQRKTAAPPRPEEPDATGEAPAAPAAETTPGGLPVRVPQASIAPALRTEGTPSAAGATAGEDDVPTPEEIRRSFGGLQAGTRRGRTDAATRSRTDATDPTPAPVEDAQEDNQ